MWGSVSITKGHLAFHDAAGSGSEDWQILVKQYQKDSRMDARGIVPKPEAEEVVSL